MRTILNGLRYSTQSYAARAWVALLAAAMLTMSAGAAKAGAQKPIILNQTANLGTLSGGGGTESSSNPVGGTMAVNADGDAIIGTTYGSTVLLYHGSTQTVLAKPSSQTGAVAVDAQNNLFMGFTYGGPVVKLPYVNGVYAAFTNPSSSTPACTGNDTVECSMANVTAGAKFPIVSLAFDSQGDLFYGIQNDSSGAGTSGITNPNTIWECTAANLYAASGAPTMIFTEPAPTVYNKISYQLTLGGLAVDPWGNVFFTDGAVDASGNIYLSNVNELPLTSGAYAATATVLYTNSQSSAPGPYVDVVSGVSVDANGTVYFTDIYNGVAAIPNTGTALTEAGVASSMYTVSTQGLKLMAVGHAGNIFGSSYDSAASGDAVYRTDVYSATGTASPVGTASTATNIEVVDNLAGCTTPPAITFAASESGAASTEFAAVTTGKCGGTYTGGSQYSVTLTFDPTNAGQRVALLTATDATNTGSGTATVSGTGQGALITVDPGLWSSYATGLTDPYAIAVDTKGDLFIADPGAKAVFEFKSGSTGATTPTSIGTGFVDPYALAFDADGNLYVADAGLSEVIELALGASGTVDGSIQSVFISSTVMFSGAPLDKPSALAFGPHGVLYIADLGGGAGEGRVLTYNPANGLATARITGLSFPWGVAIDPLSGDLAVGETGAGHVDIYTGDDAAAGTLAPDGISSPWGVAFDASGSLVISDRNSGKILRVPNVKGALAGADAVDIGSNPKSALGIALDVNGNLYSTDGTAATAFTVQRTASGDNLGTVNDDSTATGLIYVESAGNQALTLSNPIVTAPTPSGDGFSIVPSTTDGCSSGNLAAGTTCDLTAAFAPPNALVANSYSATSTLASNALNAPALSITLSGTAVFENLKSQTITFPNPFPKRVVYGNLVKLFASASSGLAVSYSVTGPAVLESKAGVNPAVLKITGVGSVTITASQPGDGTTWAAATPVSYTVTTVKAALDIIANDVTVLYGHAIPKLTYSAIGFVNGDTKAVLSGAPVETTKATDGSPIGKYLITITNTKGTLSAANYTLSFIDGELTIKALGITATPTLSPKPKTYPNAFVFVTIKDTTPGAVIYYTTNGDTPTRTVADKYTGPFKVKKTETVTAIAVAPGYDVSAPVSGKYTIVPPTATPSFTVGTGTVTKGTKVAIRCATTGATIYYTFTPKGTPPSQTKADQYTGPITINSTGTLEAIAIAPGDSVSAAALAVYTIK